MDLTQPAGRDVMRLKERKVKSLSPPKSSQKNLESPVLSKLKKDSTEEDDKNKKFNKDRQEKHQTLNEKKILGQGGQNRVYAARVETNTHTVVPYAVRESMDAPAAAQRQDYNEVLAIVSDSPFFAKRFGKGKTDANTSVEYWELADAGSLESMPIAYQNIPQVFFAICHAVKILHNKKYVHRDLKPANILWGNDGVPKLIDFDHVVDVRKGMREFVLTPQYAPIELIQAEVKHGQISEELRANLNHFAIDVWPLGGTLYSLYTGLVPPRNNKGEFIGFDKQEDRAKFAAIHPTAEHAIPLITSFMSKSPNARLKSFNEIEEHPFFAQVDKGNFLIYLQYGPEMGKKIIELNNKVKKLNGDSVENFKQKLSLYEDILRDFKEPDVFDADDKQMVVVEREAEFAGYRAMLQDHNYVTYQEQAVNQKLTESPEMTQQDKKKYLTAVENFYWATNKNKYIEAQRNIILENILVHNQKKYETSKANLEKIIEETKIAIAISTQFAHIPSLHKRILLNAVPDAEAVTEMPSLKSWLNDNNWRELKKRNDDLTSFGRSFFGRGLNLESLLKKYYFSQTRQDKKKYLTDLLITLIEFPRSENVRERFERFILAVDKKIINHFQDFIVPMREFFIESVEAEAYRDKRDGMYLKAKIIDGILRQFKLQLMQNDEEERLVILKEFKALWRKHLINFSLEDLKQRVLLQKEALEEDNRLLDPGVRSTLNIEAPRTLSTSFENLPELKPNTENNQHNNQNNALSSNRRLLRRQSSKKLPLLKEKKKDNLIPLLERWQEKTGFKGRTIFCQFLKIANELEGTVLSLAPIDDLTNLTNRITKIKQSPEYKQQTKVEIEEKPEVDLTKDIRLVKQFAENEWKKDLEKSDGVCRFDQLIEEFYSCNNKDKKQARMPILCKIIEEAWHWLTKHKNNHPLFLEVRELFFRAITTLHRQARLLLKENPQIDLATVLNGLPKKSSDLIDQVVEDNFPKKSKGTLLCGCIPFWNNREETTLPETPGQQVVAPN